MPADADTEEKIVNVLILCTGNSARSILAECSLNHMGGGRFRAYSAGSQPNGRVNPFALQALQAAAIPSAGARSKSWDEFAVPDAPQMELVITVCDNAAGEVCPFWPGHPATVHWGYADPAAVEGSDDEKRAAFRHTLQAISKRMQALINLPIWNLDRAALQQAVRALT